MRRGKAARAQRVAVCFSGWLAVRVPQRGASARRHLIDVLGADVFVAGTYWPHDACAPGASESKRSACLLRRLQGLGPLTRTALDPMLTHDDLRRLVSRSPNWPAVVAAFREASTFGGISVWAPLLGPTVHEQPVGQFSGHPSQLTPAALPPRGHSRFRNVELCMENLELSIGTVKRKLMRLYRLAPIGLMGFMVA